MAELEYVSAVVEYDLVLTDPSASEAQQQEARIYAGMAHRFMSNDVEARLQFLAAIKNNPNVTLPPGDHAPKLVSFFELIKLEAAPSAAAGSMTQQPVPTDKKPVGMDVPLSVIGLWVAGAALGLAGTVLALAGGGLDLYLYATGSFGGGNGQFDPADFLGPAIGGAAIVSFLLAGGLAVTGWALMPSAE